MSGRTVYHGSMALVGLAFVASGVGTILEPGTSGLAGGAAAFGGVVLLAASGYALSTGTASEPPDWATWLAIFAAVLSTAGVVLTYLG